MAVPPMARDKERPTLFVIRSSLGSKALVALAQVMITKKHKILVVAGGKAASQFEDAGIPLFFRGTEEDEKIPCSLDCFSLLRFYKPKVMIVGVNKFIRLERDAIKALTQYNILCRPSIKLVVLEIEPETIFRLGAHIPDVILTQNAKGKKVAEEEYRDILAYEIGGINGDTALSAKKYSPERTYQYLKKYF